MAVTGHWIESVDGKWKLRRTLLDFIYLSEMHIGEYLGQELHRTLKDLGVLTKASTD